MGGAVSSLAVLKDASLFRGAVLSAAAIIAQEEVAKPHLVYLAKYSCTFIIGDSVLITPFISRPRIKSYELRK